MYSTHLYTYSTNFKTNCKFLHKCFACIKYCKKNCNENQYFLQSMRPHLLLWGLRRSLLLLLRRLRPGRGRGRDPFLETDLEATRRSRLSPRSPGLARASAASAKRRLAQQEQLSERYTSFFFMINN